jgi:hypothetical protein
MDIRFTPFLFTRTTIAIAGFPAGIFLLGADVSVDYLHRLMKRLMSDTLLPYAMTNFALRSSRKCSSLSQELYGVTRSFRHVLISWK